MRRLAPLIFSLGFSGMLTGCRPALDQMFGIQLGRPLPSNCAILASWTNQNKGCVLVDLVPPKTDRDWSQYCALLVSNKAVGISAHSKSPESSIAALMRRLGKPNENGQQRVIAWTNTACGVFVSSDSNSGVVACVEVESIPAFALLTGITASSQIESERRTAELARKLSEIESNSTARMTEVNARFKTEEEKQNNAEAEAAKREAEYLGEQQVVSVKSGELHQWNLNNGRAIQASYVSASATVVTLKQDGQLFNLRIADLSDADQKLVESCRR